MPVHVLSQFLLEAYDEFHLSPLSWIGVVLVTVVLLIRLWASSRPAAALPRDVARDLTGKLVIMTGAFSTTGYPVFTRLAKRGARIVAVTKSPVSSRDHQLLHLATVASDNDQLFVETCDLQCITDIRRFASEWETKAATRRGALGEEIGRSHVDSILLMPEAGQGDETIEFVRALAPSLTRANTVPGAPADSTNTTTRIVYVLPSSFYAAADAEDYTADGEVWQNAQDSLYTAARLIEFGKRQQAQEGKPGQGKLAVVAVSPGTTRTFALSHLRPRPREKWYLLIIPWSFILIAYPWIWAAGKSSSEAARTVEWALLAPLEEKRATADKAIKVPLVKPLTLYRNTVDAGSFLRHVREDDLRKKLYDEDEARIDKLLASETKKDK